MSKGEGRGPRAEGRGGTTDGNAAAEGGVVSSSALSQSALSHSALAQLTLVRFREFIREPEAVFWTFIFPILLAAGLGIAFRQSGPDKSQIGVLGTAPGAAALHRQRQSARHRKLHEFHASDLGSSRKARIRTQVKSASK